MTPGTWVFPNFSLQSNDYSEAPTAYRYVSLSRYNYQAASSPVALASGDTVSLPPFSVTTTAIELTFDVIEPAGATAETLISNPYLSGYTTTYDSSGSALASLSVYASTSGNAQAKPSVKLIGEPGFYTVQAYGNVDGSNVSFGTFTIELKVPLVTPVGPNVTVQPDAHTTVVFSNVTTEGVTTAAEIPVGPALPPGYSALTDSAGQKVFYSISTTAAYNGSVEVTVNFDPASVPAGSTGHLSLLAYNSATQQWTDITTSVDATNHLATGDSATLALFVLALTNDPVLDPVTVPAGGLTGAALDFSASFTDADSGDQHTALWSWGDGSSLTPGTVDETTGAITGQHTYAQAGTYHGTLGLTDATGNIVTRDFTVVVGSSVLLPPPDTTAPVITVSANVTAEASGPAGAVVSFTVSATDETDGAVATSATPASGSTFALGTTVVTVTATDAAGNTATSTISVTVQDTTPPAITVPSLSTTEAIGPGGASVTFASSASDLVDGSPALSYSVASGSTFPIGTTAVTVTATDASGNSSTSSFNVTVADTTAPVLTLPGNQTLEATSANGAVATFAATATDSVGATVAYSKASGSTFPLGTTTVTVTATDAAGNSATGSFTVTVTDTTAPVVTAPANIAGVEATGPSGATVTFAATVSDAVGATLSYSKAPGSVFPIGTTTVTVTATDAAGNTAVAKTFAVTVNDTAGPVLTLPSGITVEATSDEGAKVTFAATAADLVSGVRSVSYSKAPGSTFPIGTTTVTVTSKDAAGNKSTGSFTVTVADTTAPKLKLPANLTVKAKNAAGTRVEFEASAKDAVSDRVTLTYSKASGSTFPLGTTTVTVTAKDAAGNTSTGTFTVTVVDSTKPVFTKLSVTPSVITNANGQLVAVTVTATATDNVDAAPTVRIISITSDETLAAGDATITGALTARLRASRDSRGNGRIYTITVQATDAAGNTVTRTVHVLVPKGSGTKFEDCDKSHRTEKQRCDDEDRDNDSRDHGDRDDDNRDRRD